MRIVVDGQYKVLVAFGDFVLFVSPSGSCFLVGICYAALRLVLQRVPISQEWPSFRANVDRALVSRAERGVRQPVLATGFLPAAELSLKPHELVPQAEAPLASP